MAPLSHENICTEHKESSEELLHQNTVASSSREFIWEWSFTCKFQQLTTFQSWLSCEFKLMIYCNTMIELLCKLILSYLSVSISSLFRRNTSCSPHLFSSVNWLVSVTGTSQSSFADNLSLSVSLCYVYMCIAIILPAASGTNSGFHCWWLKLWLIPPSWPQDHKSDTPWPHDLMVGEVSYKTGTSCATHSCANALLFLGTCLVWLGWAIVGPALCVSPHVIPSSMWSCILPILYLFIFIYQHHLFSQQVFRLCIHPYHHQMQRCIHVYMEASSPLALQSASEVWKHSMRGNVVISNMEVTFLKKNKIDIFLCLVIYSLCFGRYMGQLPPCIHSKSNNSHGPQIILVPKVTAAVM